MAINVECKKCGQKYALPESMRGSTKRCGKCESSIRVPGRMSWFRRTDGNDHRGSLILKNPKRPRPLFWMSIGAVVASSAIFGGQAIQRATTTTEHHPISELSVYDDPEKLTEAQRVYNKTIESIVYIYGFRDKRRVSHASGFIVDPGDKIVTNEHVIDGVDYLIIETYWRKRFRIDRHIGVNEYRDLAILPLPADVSATGLQISNSAHEVGERVFTIGSPNDVRFGISEGVIVSMNTTINTGKMVQADISAAPGASGSPLLDVNGQVVGVISSGAEHNRKYTYSVPTKVLFDLIEDAHSPVKMSD